MVKVGNFEYTKSTKPDKKLMVTVEKGGKKKTSVKFRHLVE